MLSVDILPVYCIVTSKVNIVLLILAVMEINT